MGLFNFFSVFVGLVHITSWYLEFNGSHFGLPPSFISTKWLDWVAKWCELWRMSTDPIFSVFEQFSPTHKMTPNKNLRSILCRPRGHTSGRGHWGFIYLTIYMYDRSKSQNLHWKTGKKIRSLHMMSCFSEFNVSHFSLQPSFIQRLCDSAGWQYRVSYDSTGPSAVQYSLPILAFSNIERTRPAHDLKKTL